MTEAQWQPVASADVMQKRARMLQLIRAFFYERDVLEVDTPVFSTAAATDPHIDSFSSKMGARNYYLHTSPEFAMKRLLAAGCGSIYQVCKVFRLEEQGPVHNPEFSMLEWYRLDFDDGKLMAEIQALISTLATEFGMKMSFSRITYQQVFQQKLGIDPLDTSVALLKDCCVNQRLEIPQGMSETDQDEWLDWLFTQRIMPEFDKNSVTFLTDYPASQCSLAKLNDHNSLTAARFEAFYGELELANGFYELTDPAEQRSRFIKDNDKRLAMGKNAMPVDTNLLDAMTHGLPDCAGVAVGLDRLLMMLTGANTISDVMAFPFDRA